MTPPRTRIPVWLLGLSNATFGLYGGFAIVTLPQLLAARHVPEQAIASTPSPPHPERSHTEDITLIYNDTNRSETKRGSGKPPIQPCS